MIAESKISIGMKVHLRGCPHGQPGTVIRRARGRLTVSWPDIDYLGRHRPDSLIEAAPSPQNLFSGDHQA